MYADPKAVRLGFITGVLPTHKTRGFERVAFRATRGNMFLKQSAVDGKVDHDGTETMFGQFMQACKAYDESYSMFR